MVRTSDKEACGEVISSPREEIFIVDGAVNIKKYKIPKSKIKFLMDLNLFCKYQLN
ncbi:MAG TPA: hypothetical protein VFM31_00170 [Nitrososphaeraceae archaeon]|nr:hypothetical protein [Nitrososphaeraceae archaeon]